MIRKCDLPEIDDDKLKSIPSYFKFDSTKSYLSISYSELSYPVVLKSLEHLLLAVKDKKARKELTAIIKLGFFGDWTDELLAAKHGIVPNISFYDALRIKEMFYSDGASPLAALELMLRTSNLKDWVANTTIIPSSDSDIQAIYRLRKELYLCAFFNLVNTFGITKYYELYKREMGHFNEPFSTATEAMLQFKQQWNRVGKLIRLKSASAMLIDQYQLEVPLILGLLALHSKVPELIHGLALNSDKLLTRLRDCCILTCAKNKSVFYKTPSWSDKISSEMSMSLIYAEAICTTNKPKDTSGLDQTPFYEVNGTRYLRPSSDKIPEITFKSFRKIKLPPISTCHESEAGNLALQYFLKPEQAPILIFYFDPRQMPLEFPAPQLKTLFFPFTQIRRESSIGYKTTSKLLNYFHFPNAISEALSKVCTPHECETIASKIAELTRVNIQFQITHFLSQTRKVNISGSSRRDLKRLFILLGDHSSLESEEFQSILHRIFLNEPALIAEHPSQAPNIHQALQTALLALMPYKARPNTFMMLPEHSPIVILSNLSTSLSERIYQLSVSGSISGECAFKTLNTNYRVLSILDTIDYNLNQKIIASPSLYVCTLLLLRSICEIMTESDFKLSNNQSLKDLLKYRNILRGLLSNMPIEAVKTLLSRTDDLLPPSIVSYKSSGDDLFAQLQRAAESFEKSTVDELIMNNGLDAFISEGVLLDTMHEDQQLASPLFSAAVAIPAPQQQGSSYPLLYDHDGPAQKKARLI